MKKLILSLFLLSSFFLVKPALAGTNITITCNSGSACTKSSELPLFSETNIYPGYSVSQNFSIDNKRTGPCQLKLKAVSTSQVPDLLSQKILINISGINNNYSLVDYPLNDLLNPTKPSVSLGHVNKNIKNSYLWSVILDKNATNEYQNQTTAFNINFNFECDEETGDSPSNISNNPSSNQGSPTCTNKSTPDAPTHLIATRLDNNNISLTWDHTISEHDGYLIAFGTTPGNYQYGAPNVGNVSSYTVKGLTPGAQYCFYVRSLNGCMPGDRTPEYCINPGSTIIASTSAPENFQPNVLGETIDNSSNTSDISVSDGSIKGATNNNQKYYLPLFFIMAFILNTIIFSYHKHLSLLALLISAAAYLIDNLLLKKYTCSIEVFCQYFWIGCVLSFIAPYLFSRLSKTK